LVARSRGTGKTTALVSLLEKIYDTNSFYFLTFSRAAAKEAMDRFAEKIKMHDTLKKRFRTIHSLCMELVGAKRRQLLMGKDYAKIFGAIGMQAPAGKKGHANTSDHLKNWVDTKILRLQEVEYDDTCPVNKDVLGEYLKESKDYKAANGKYSFTDLLTTALGKLTRGNVTVEIDYLVNDEVQDLSPLQWSILNIIAEQSKNVVMAGDDDQMIYGFAGASCKRMLELEKEGYEIKVLPKSYRIPSSVHSLSQHLISQIANRYPKDYKPTSNKGFVYDVSTIGELAYALREKEGSWFVLGRTNYIVEKTQHLIESQFGKLLHVEYMTFHQSKGREADNVAVLMEITSKVVTNMDLEAEYKLLYVAMTRTKKRLYLVSPEGANKHQLVLFRNKEQSNEENQEDCSEITT
jgi:superfamily I DNA/RNA helicase